MNYFILTPHYLLYPYIIFILYYLLHQGLELRDIISLFTKYDLQ